MKGGLVAGFAYHISEEGGGLSLVFVVDHHFHGSLGHTRATTGLTHDTATKHHRIVTILSANLSRNNTNMFPDRIT